MYSQQGRCLQNAKQPAFMSFYDGFDPATRKRLRDSHFDLCAACVQDIAREIARDRRMYELPEIFYCEAIDQMERQIRAGEAPQAQ